MSSFFSFLSIAKKSGKIVEGYSKCDDARNSQKFYLFILSSDLSLKSKSKFKKHCENKNIPYIEDFSKEELGDALGRPEVKILGIQDKNIADKLIKLYEEEKYMDRK